MTYVKAYFLPPIALIYNILAFCYPKPTFLK